jgi:hypothetical protein
VLAPPGPASPANPTSHDPATSDPFFTSTGGAGVIRTFEK